jgi:hypothetical protein
MAAGAKSGSARGIVRAEKDPVLPVHAAARHAVKPPINPKSGISGPNDLA